MHYVRTHAWGIFVLMLGIGALLMLVPIGMRLSVASYTYTSLDTAPETEVAIVLGASVVHGVPSPLLAKRADAALALYRKGKVKKILVTGDNGALSHDEVTPVREYLLDAGVPPQDIFLDHAGFDTYSSMYRARDVFQAHSLTIATQDFHLPRALWIARRLGLPAYGYIAEGGESSLRNYLREIPASLKALLEVSIRREPKYLGPAFPLTGDGQATWY